MSKLYPSSTSPRLSLLLSLALIFHAATAHGQQSDVRRYDLYAGYTNLNSPALGLDENGFHFQAGVNPRSWYSLGFDYSVSTGDLVLTQSELTPADQRLIGGAIQLYGPVFHLPANYALAVPAHSFTQTFAGGPQYEYRHFSKATFFLRPAIGAIRELATPHPNDAFSTLIVSQLAPSGSKLNWTAFYGAGGGVDYSLNPRFGVRVQLDFVHDHLFSDLLANGRNTLRMSIGPSFHFGKEIAR